MSSATAITPYLAVIGVSALQQIFSMTWFGPLFGKLFMKLTYERTGRKPSMDRMTESFMSSFFGAILLNFAIFRALVYLSVGTASDAAFVGAFFAFVAASTDIVHYAWDDKVFGQVLLSHGYHFLVNSFNAVLLFNMLVA